MARTEAVWVTKAKHRAHVALLDEYLKTRTSMIQYLWQTNSASSHLLVHRPPCVVTSCTEQLRLGVAYLVSFMNAGIAQRRTCQSLWDNNDSCIIRFLWLDDYTLDTGHGLGCL